MNTKTTEDAAVQALLRSSHTWKKRTSPAQGRVYDNDVFAMWDGDEATV